MKRVSLSLCVVGLMALGIGCSKQEQPAPQTTTGARDSAASSASQAQKPATETAVKETVQSAQTAAQQVAKDAAASAVAKADELKAKAQTIIDQASKLVAGSKYEEAANLLENNSPV